MTTYHFSKIALCFFLLTGAVSLAACNTIEGAGKDIESTGGAIEDAAD